ncbi:unnamed protein product [Cladocopium goreaui]|uniref:Uncharacterized protein n=1 Tax=Cladocopium goreaui TaxID=2562237 RepID=A0A9P1D5I7_9DINO|nr:unnamed protein product [Cladocopium goreaui]
MAEGELGVDWGDDDPGLDADVSLLEPESKRQKTGHIPAEAPRASEAKIEPGHAAAELPEAKLPDRVKEALNGVSSFEEYRRKRVFKYLHVYSGPEDVLGKAIKAEATKERRGCEVTSLDKLVNKDLDMTDVNQHRELCQEVRAGEYDGMHVVENPWPPPVRSLAEIYGLSSNPKERQSEADKGTIGDDKCGTGWELPELKQSLEKVGANKVPFNTCSFQQKLKVRHFKPAMWAGKLEGLAPLSRVCRCPAWIIHEPLIGKSKTVKAGRYPDELCEAVAKLVVAGEKNHQAGVLETPVEQAGESGIGTSTQMVVERGEEVR